MKKLIAIILLANIATGLLVMQGIEVVKDFTVSLPGFLSIAVLVLGVAAPAWVYCYIVCRMRMWRRMGRA